MLVEEEEPIQQPRSVFDRHVPPPPPPPPPLALFSQPRPQPGPGAGCWNVDFFDKDAVPVFHTADNLVFLLDVLLRHMGVDEDLRVQEIAARRQRIRKVMLTPEERKTPRGLAQKNDQHLQTGIDAMDLIALFDLYDQEFFEGGIAAVFYRHKRRLHFHVVSDLGTQAGHFSRRGFDHDLTISWPALALAFTKNERIIDVCGIPCRDRLEALMCVFEHELTHLICFTNWLHCEEPHGLEFRAVAGAFFRHMKSTHQLPTGILPPPLMPADSGLGSAAAAAATAANARRISDEQFLRGVGRDAPPGATGFSDAYAYTAGHSLFDDSLLSDLRSPPLSDTELFPPEEDDGVL